MFAAANFQGLVVNPQGLPGFSAPIMSFDSDSIQDGNRHLEKMLARYSKPPTSREMRDSALATGQAFLEGELEKPDFKLYEPLWNYTWPRDIVVKTGGGWVDYTSNFFVDYGTPGANQYGLIAGDTNALAEIQGNVSKDLWPVNNFGYLVKVPFMNAQRMQQAGRSLEDILQKGLRTNYDLALNENVYKGFTSINSTGLLNNPNISQNFARLNGAGTSRKWRDKSPKEILDDVNGGINLTWAQAEYDLKGMANHVLIPPDDFNYINGTMVSEAGTQSILSFLMANNTAQAQGRNLVIAPCRQCIDAGEADISGTESSGRAMFYVNDEEMVCFDETVPLTRIITQPSAADVAYLSVYVAKVGIVKFLYEQPATYLDGIS